MDSASVFSLEVHYSGHIQHIGFRQALLEAARGFEVRGRVENLDDGRVRLLAQGPRREVEAFAAEIEHRMKPFIRQAEHRRPAAPPTLVGFTLA